MHGYNHNQPAKGNLVCSLIASLAALCAAPSALAVDSGDIVITSLKGEVHVTMSGSECAVRAGAVLELPATVRTGADGAIELRQGATSVSVGPDTLLEFPALAKRDGPIDRIVQPHGNAFYDIGKREKRKLRIETPWLVGVVKGTQFNVVAQDGAATISLFEGLLEVRSTDGDDVIDLHAGEIASFSRADSDISVLKMSSDKPVAPSSPPAPSAPRSPPGTGGSGDSTPAAEPASDASSRDHIDELFAARDVSNSRPGIAPPVFDPAPVVDPVPIVDVGGSPLPVDPAPVADLNVDLGVTVGGANELPDVSLGLDDDSGQSNNGNNGNSGNGNNGNGQGNDGIGPGNNGQGNNDKGTVVDDILDTVRGKSGKK